MSCYEWERGTITIPKPQWASFRKNLLSQWNAREDEVLAKAKKAFAAAKAAAKGKRGEKRTQAINAALASACGGSIDEWGYFQASRRVSGYWGGSYERDEKAHELHSRISRLVLKSEGYGKNAKVSLVAPKAKDLNKVKISQDASLHFSDATVTFNNRCHAVEWCVHENNHAKEHAHAHWFAQALFSALKGIKWTRNSGGTVVGNDEYNRESHYEGGAANYVTMTFGPERKQSSRRSRYAY